MRLSRLIILILFLLINSSVFSQSDSVNVTINVTNKVENDNWFNDFVSLDKKQQIKAFKERLLKDTIAFVLTKSVFRGEQFIVDFYCRPFIKVNGQDVYIDNSVQTKKFIELLDDSHIAKLEVLTPDVAKERFGKYGLCGMLLFISKDKTILDKLNKMKG